VQPHLFQAFGGSLSKPSELPQPVPSENSLATAAPKSVRLRQFASRLVFVVCYSFLCTSERWARQYSSSAFPDWTVSHERVFISYRRDSSGKSFARLLEQALTHEGYDVFLDVDDISPGKWADQILSQVPQRAHFLLVLTPGVLDRCVDPNDWVRREFELAVKSGRNIVPVREESVDLGKAAKECPDSMKGVFDLQIAPVRHDAFEHDIEELIDRYIPPDKAPKPSQPPASGFHADISRIDKYAPAELIGCEAETKLLNDAWDQAVRGEAKRPHVLTFVPLGGEG
jgi:hypothetical protein